MEQKLIQDFLLATQDTIFILQKWSGRLEQWQSQGQIEPEDFVEACRQLREAGLWAWAADAGGHGIATLAATLINEPAIRAEITD